MVETETQPDESERSPVWDDPPVGEDVEECSQCHMLTRYTRKPFLTLPHGECEREPIEVNW